jgi:predicted alpha/beta-hydrolase family hydrolase
MSEVVSDGPVRGFLHPAGDQNSGKDGLILAHGAGSDARAPLLAAVAETFAAAGITVLRIDLPFRQARPHGPPHPGNAALDRQGIAQAVEWLRARVPGRIFLGGHSYGGRQSTMLAAEQPQLADRLLLLSYPLHPPRRPEQLRTSHFPNLRTPALFVHGTRDPFGSIEELHAAVALIPAEVSLLPIERAGHELAPAPRTAEAALQAFRLIP